MSVHSPLADEYLANCGGRLGPSQALTHAAFRWIERRCYRASDAVQCFSRFIASLVSASSPGSAQVSVCPGYVDYAAMAIDLPRGEARRRLGPEWHTEEACFFSLRRHAPRMGLDRLIQAFARVRRESPDARCRLLIGGEGPQTPMLAALIRELRLESHAHLIGRIDEAAKALHYRAADCFVLPTTALEGFGLIVLEAFAAGTPVIATPVGAIPEVVDGHGTLTEDAGEDAIARAMLGFLARGADEAQAARRGYAAGFDKAAILPRLERIVMAGHA
jgi:glycosyltransferase involved in cell wall biosynthesis